MKEKVIQFGEGGFLRGFADWMLQIVNEKTDFGGKVVVVQPIENGMCDILSAQNCEYTHICRGLEGVDTKKVDGTTWYYTCLNPVSGLCGWTLASGYNAPIKHTAITVDPNPDKPDIPDIAEKKYVDAGMYYLDAIKLNEEKNAITIRGLLSIGNMDNTLETDISYKLVLTNQQDGTILEIPMDRWTNTSEHPFDATSIPGYKNNFSGAWSTQTFNFKDKEMF